MLIFAVVIGGGVQLQARAYMECGIGYIMNKIFNSCPCCI